MQFRKNNPLSCEIPDDLKTFKARATFWVMWHLYLMDLGRGKVFGKFTQLFPEMGLFIMILDKLGLIALSIWQMVIVFMFAMLSIWFFGWLYQRLEFDKIDTYVSRRRDPMMKAVFDKVGGKYK